MPSDMSQSRMMKAVRNLASYIGIGVVSIDDPDYIALCQAHRTISIAHRKGDFTTVLTTLDRDYTVQRADHVPMKRSEVVEQLRTKLENQIQTDYREEPAHMVIRGKRAQVASRIFSKSICRKDGKLVEIQERGEHLTVWTKSRDGWKRLRTRIRSHEQNIEWIPEPQDTSLEPKRTEKFLV